MVKKSQKPILVTGSHRSGSTWVGNMLSIPPNVAYVNEPFNIQYHPGTPRPHFEHWFTYVCEENEALHYKYIQDCLTYKPHILQKTLKYGSINDLKKQIRYQGRMLNARRTGKRPLMKDPLAILAAEWLANTFDMEVVLLIRHPAAFVGSLMKGSLENPNWSHPFDHFLQQPLLMEKYLSEFESEITKYAETKQNIMDQGILLWNIIYSMVLKYQASYDQKWTFIKHERISADPLLEFKQLYQRLNLPYSESVEKRIAEFSFVKPEDQDSQHRDSRTVIKNWQKRLTKDEIAHVKEKTDRVSSQYYSDEDWE